MVCTKDPMRHRIRFALVCRSSDWHVQAFLPTHILRLLSSSPMTCFRRKRMSSILTAQCRNLHRVQVFHLIPLFSRTRSRVSLFRARSRDCHKNRSNIMFYFFRILQFFCIVKHNNLHNTLHLQGCSRRCTHVNLSKKIHLFGHTIHRIKTPSVILTKGVFRCFSI